MSEPSNLETRVLLVPASAVDQRMTEKVMREAKIELTICRNLSELCQEMDRGAAVLLLPAAISRRDSLFDLVDRLKNQPAWSDLPVVFLADRRSPPPPDLVALDVATILHPPLHVVELLSIVRSGIVARRRQYEIRDLLEQQQRIQHELREMDRRKDIFLATLAHELRNPISPIQSALDLLDVESGSLQDEDDLRRVIKQQVRQLRRIVDDLLDVSRITRGNIRLVKNVIDIRDCISNGIESARPFITTSRQSLSVNLGEHPVYVFADAARIAQVTANLLNNAAKYTPRHGRIELCLKHEGQWVILEVQDTGIGVSEEKAESIFDLFQQHDIEKERGQAGLGIGLSLVQQLLRLHGGSISVSSRGTGLGSTFTVRLPGTDAPETGYQTPPETCDFSAVGRPRSILVVEDMRSIRFVIKRLLEKLGHQVLTAENGYVGLVLAEQSRPDLILSDISMPKMNGYQMVQKLRQDPAFATTRIIAMTGYGQKEDREKALASGFDDHLTKPVDVDQIQRILGELDTSRSSNS